MTLTKEDLSAIAGLLQPLKDDIADLKSDMTELKNEVSGLKNEVVTLKSEVVTLKSEVAALKSEVATLKDDVNDLKNRVTALEGRVTGLELHLENTTDKNILIIAEGHLDLSRKLDRALTVENEKELFFIRVNLLEREVRKLKEQVQR